MIRIAGKSSAINPGVLANKQTVAAEQSKDIRMDES